MNATKNSPYENILQFVEETSPASDLITDSLATTSRSAQEFGLFLPDAITAEFLAMMGARSQGAAVASGHTATGIVMSPACAVIGLHLFQGMPHGHLTCIEPEVQFQNLARTAFSAAGKKPNSFRFLPSTPLDVAGRLANDSYDIAVAECAIEDLQALCEATLPTLRPGGCLILLDSLLDGVVADATRNDRQTLAAREADSFFRSLDNVHTARLPLGAGLSVITKL